MINYNWFLNAESWGLKITHDYTGFLPFDRIVGESTHDDLKRISFEKNNKSYIWQGSIDFFESNQISDTFGFNPIKELFRSGNN